MQITTQLLHNLRSMGFLLCARPAGRRFGINTSVYKCSAIILVAGLHRLKKKIWVKPQHFSGQKGDMRQVPYRGFTHITRLRTKFRLVAMATCLLHLCTRGPYLACFSFVRVSSGLALIQVVGLQRYCAGRDLIPYRSRGVLWWTVWY